MNWGSDARFTDCKLKSPILKCCVSHPRNKRKSSVLAHWVKSPGALISKITSDDIQWAVYYDKTSEKYFTLILHGILTNIDSIVQTSKLRPGAANWYGWVPKSYYTKTTGSPWNGINMALGPTTSISGEYLSIFTLSPYSGDSCLKICALKLPGILVNMFQNNGSLS